MEGQKPQIGPIVVAGQWALQSANLGTFYLALYLVACLSPPRLPAESMSAYWGRIGIWAGRKVSLVSGTVGTAAMVVTALQNSRHCEDRLNYAFSGLVAAGVWSKPWGLSRRAVMGWALIAGLFGPFLFSPLS